MIIAVTSNSNTVWHCISQFSLKPLNSKATFREQLFTGTDITLGLHGAAHKTGNASAGHTEDDNNSNQLDERESAVMPAVADHTFHR